MELKEVLKSVEHLAFYARKQVDRLFSGAYRSVFKGSGLDFHEIRPYEFGDDVRLIDWRTTAKMDKPYVKIYKEERQLYLTLFLDSSASMRVYQKWETLLVLYAITLYSAYKNSDKFATWLFTDQVETLTPYEQGREAFMAQLRNAFYHKPLSKKTNLSAALKKFRHFINRKTLLFIFSDFLFDDYLTTLAALAQRHEIWLFHLWSKRELYKSIRGVIPIQDVEKTHMQWIWNRKKDRPFFQMPKHIEGFLRRQAKHYGFCYVSLCIEEQPLKRFKQSILEPLLCA